MNQLNVTNVEQAVAALVNHYVAASAGLVSESVNACYGYHKMAFLFAYEAERGANPPSGKFVTVGKPFKSKKDKFRSNEAFVANGIKTSEPLNAFLNFAREKMAGVSLEGTSASASGNSQVSTGQKLNEMWVALSEEERGKYSSECVNNSLLMLAFSLKLALICSVSFFFLFYFELRDAKEVMLTQFPQPTQSFHGLVYPIEKIFLSEP
jgi:hypothetical protein